MGLLISEILSSAVQLVLFGLVPFVWWLVSARKRVGFGEWIGLKKWKSGKVKVLLLWMAGTVAGFWLIGQFGLYVMKDVQTATSSFAGLGLRAVPAVAVYAVFHTALTEELLFRGFLLKRVAARFGFQTGNFVQALLFGMLHGVMLVSAAGFLKAALLVLFTAAIAWTMGYINEKKAGGSILPGWVIHGVTNILSGMAAAF